MIEERLERARAQIEEELRQATGERFTVGTYFDGNEYHFLCISGTWKRRTQPFSISEHPEPAQLVSYVVDFVLACRDKDKQIDAKNAQAMEEAAIEGLAALIGVPVSAAKKYWQERAAKHLPKDSE